MEGIMNWIGIGNLIYYSCQPVSTATLDLFWCLLQVAAEVVVITLHFVNYSGGGNIKKKVTGQEGSRACFSIAVRKALGEEKLGSG